MNPRLCHLSFRVYMQLPTGHLWVSPRLLKCNVELRVYSIDQCFSVGPPPFPQPFLLPDHLSQEMATDTFLAALADVLDGSFLSLPLSKSRLLPFPTESPDSSALPTDKAVTVFYLDHCKAFYVASLYPELSSCYPFSS